METGGLLHHVRQRVQGRVCLLGRYIYKMSGLTVDCLVRKSTSQSDPPLARRHCNILNPTSRPSRWGPYFFLIDYKFGNTFSILKQKSISDNCTYTVFKNSYTVPKSNHLPKILPRYSVPNSKTRSIHFFELLTHNLLENMCNDNAAKINLCYIYKRFSRQNSCVFLLLFNHWNCNLLVILKFSFF